MLGTNATAEAIEVGYFQPDRNKKESLQSGEVGYIATGLKDVDLCRVGDTITKSRIKDQRLKIKPLKGYHKIKPMVFSQIFCVDNADYNKLKDALAKLKLNDASLFYEAVNSPALGFGFRCGFLGLLHMDIIRERLTREFNLDIVLTAPTVNYKVHFQNSQTQLLNNPSELPRLLREFLELKREVLI